MKFYKVTDQSIIENIKIAFQQRADFKKQWNDYAKSLGFESAGVKTSDLPYGEIKFVGFVVPKEKFKSVDRDVFKFIMAIKKDDSTIWMYKKGNKKQYAEFISNAPFLPEYKVDLTIATDSLIEHHLPVAGLQELVLTSDDEVYFSAGGFTIVKIIPDRSIEVKQSEFLSKQGL